LGPLVVIAVTVLQSWLVAGWEARTQLAVTPLYAVEAHRATSTAIGNDDVLVVRDDALVNVNSLRYLKRRLHLGRPHG
jgi:hypothetical protein